jgi:hypothetical protein
VRFARLDEFARRLRQLEKRLASRGSDEQ